MDRAGDKDAEFREFVRLRGPALLRSACALVADPNLAEDLVQTALISTYNAWERVRAARDPDGYAHQILFNSHRQMRRRRRLTEVLGLHADRPVVEPDLDGREQARRALDELPPKQRAVLVLRFYEDRSVEDTARLLGISEGTVKSQTSKALARLRLSHHLTDITEG